MTHSRESVLQNKFAEWTDAKSYPSRQATSMRRWAWEFLRRNPGYQTDYERWMRNAPKDKWPDPAEDLSWHECNPPAKSGETLVQYERRLRREGIGPHSITPRHFALGKKYHLRGFLPPPEDDDPPRFSTATYGPFLGGPQSEVHWLHGLAAEQVIYVFDLTLSLELQCKRALRLLKGQLNFRRQRNPELYQDRRARENPYQDYLRVLDAAGAGVRDDREIAATLFPKLRNTYENGYPISQRIRKYRTRAAELRDGGYRFLPLAEQTKKRSRNS